MKITDTIKYPDGDARKRVEKAQRVEISAALQGHNTGTYNSVQRSILVVGSCTLEVSYTSLRGPDPTHTENAEYGILTHRKVRYAAVKREGFSSWVAVQAESQKED